MEELGRALEATVADDDRTAALVAEHHALQEPWSFRLYDRRLRMSMVLSGLGFAEEDLSRSVDEFSGGWQMRIALAKVLLEAPDILLLTNRPTTGHRGARVARILLRDSRAATSWSPRSLFPGRVHR
jgi:ATPase subunit of ABC transporter with duplicated ATPase domains